MMDDTYEIIIRGHLDPRRAHWFEGMTLIPLPSGETKLTGEVRDQAALYGMLSRIRDLGLELISVRRCAADEG
jgi:hypothetical protein